MSVILIMIPAAILLAGLGVWAFIMAAKRGQFDDLDTPAIRAVFDDDDLTSQRTKAQGGQKENTPDETPGA
jgi:cbb3-type cytochrome oxidase maturation protein